MKERLKRERPARQGAAQGQGRSPLIFDRAVRRATARLPSTSAMRQLGGESITLNRPGDAAWSRRDHSRTPPRCALRAYVDGNHDPPRSSMRICSSLLGTPTVPVDQRPYPPLASPAQVLADVMTFEEHRGLIRGKTVAWSGDANNVLTSWGACRRLPFEFRLRVASPPELKPKKWADGLDQGVAGGHPDRLGSGRGGEGSRFASSPPTPGCRWVIGTERARHNLLKRYQVNARLMARAQARLRSSCTACPAHRSEEVTGRCDRRAAIRCYSMRRKNRLHAQKGILAWCLAELTHRQSRIEPHRQGPLAIERLEEGLGGSQKRTSKVHITPMSETRYRHFPVREPAATSVDDTILPFAVEALDVRGPRGAALGRLSTPSCAATPIPTPVARPPWGSHRADRDARLGAQVSRGRFILQTQNRRAGCGCWWVDFPPRPGSVPRLRARLRQAARGSRHGRRGQDGPGELLGAWSFGR